MCGSASDARERERDVDNTCRHAHFFRNTFRMFKLAVGSAVIGAATAKTYFKEDFSTDRA